MSQKELLDRLEKLEAKFSHLAEKSPKNQPSPPDFGKDIQSIQSRLQKLEKTAVRTDSSLSHQLANSISVIGLNESISTKNRILRYTWIALFIFGIGATIFFVHSTLKEYFADPYFTKVKLQNQPSYDFPPIVLCTDAWFDTSKAVSMGLSIDALRYSLGYTYSRIRETLRPENITEAKRNFSEVFLKNKIGSLYDYFMAIAADFQHITSSAEFYANATVPSYHLTVGGRARKVFMPLSSVCDSFELRPVDGSLGALNEVNSIILKFRDRTENVIDVNPIWYLFLSDGIASMYEWPLIIRPSVINILMIKARRYIALNRPEAPCVHTNRTAAACMADCATEAYKTYASCHLFWLSPHAEGVQLEQYCNSFDAPVIENGDDRDPPGITAIKHYCFDRCPRRCDRTLYEAVMEGEVPFNRYENLQAEEAGKSNLTITAISMMQQSLYDGGILTFQAVDTYSFTELVNNVGGVLGLFVGAALMTGVQLVMFCVEYLWERVKGMSKAGRSGAK